MPNEKISVIIPVYNGEKTIATAIEALLRQNYTGEMEIVVVDDGSKDATKQVVMNYPKVKYIMQANAGPAAARNRGAKEAAGEVLFFTDSDCIPEELWVSKMIAVLGDPSVAVVSGSYQIANSESVLAQCIQSEIEYRHRVLMPKFPKSFGSYNFCVRRKLFEELGGFNTDYPQASGEDNDLSYKLLAKGYRIYFEKDSVVGHRHPELVKDYLRDQFRHGYWRAFLYRDHPRMAGGDDYTFWKDILEVMVSLLAIAFGLLFILRIIPITVLVTCLFVLLGLELYFGFLMVRDPGQAIFFSLVMCFRAMARSLGFLSGLSRIFVAKIRKNI